MPHQQYIAVLSHIVLTYQLLVQAPTPLAYLLTLREALLHLLKMVPFGAALDLISFTHPSVNHIPDIGGPWMTFFVLGVVGLPLLFNPSCDFAARMQTQSVCDGQWMLLLKKRLP
jgi:hypothetical protein